MGRQRWWQITVARILALSLAFSLSALPVYRTQGATLHPALTVFLLPARDVGRYGPYTDSVTGTKEAAYGRSLTGLDGVSQMTYVYHVTPMGVTGTHPEGTWKVSIDPTAAAAVKAARSLSDNPPPNVTGTVPPGQSVGVGNWLQVVSDRGQCGAFAAFSVANLVVYVEVGEDAHASDTRRCRPEEGWVLRTEHLLYRAIIHST